MTDIAPQAAETKTGESKFFTRYLPAIARVLMGLMFFVFGLNGFVNFIPQPKDPMPEGAAAFAGALMKTGYMMRLVMGTQLLVGVLLLLNRFVPLALALIAPIIVGIVTFHIFLAPATIAPGVVVLVLELYLAWAYRGTFRPMLALRTTPGAK
ncbi:MAG: DoxX family membrane protein [Verrucomicrobia bacterium]|nr:DoxX family membrane protein [Verrucomicrobiota bacterium]